MSLRLFYKEGIHAHTFVIDTANTGIMLQNDDATRHLDTLKGYVWSGRNMLLTCYTTNQKLHSTYSV